MRGTTGGGILLLLTLVAQGFSLPTMGQERLELNDGSIMGYFLALPQQESPEPWPLAVFMGGGSGERAISFDVYRFYARELATLGWAVVVPISPDNRSFRGANVARVRELIAHLQAREDIRTGKALLAGISAGGMSALEIARQYPQDYLGIMAVPAIVRDAGGLGALRDMPIYLRIGSDDELGWAQLFDDTVQALQAAGARLDADLLWGAPHMFALDWDQVAEWLAPLQAAAP